MYQDTKVAVKANIYFFWAFQSPLWSGYRLHQLHTKTTLTDYVADQYLNYNQMALQWFLLNNPTNTRIIKWTKHKATIIDNSHSIKLVPFTSRLTTLIPLKMFLKAWKNKTWIAEVNAGVRVTKIGYFFHLIKKLKETWSKGDDPIWLLIFEE